MSLFSELKRRNVLRVALAYGVVAWLLMQVGDTLAPALLLPEWTTRFLAFLLLLGFPLAIFAAWAFELTPDGIKPEKSIKSKKSAGMSEGRKLDMLIIALLAFAVGYFIWDKFSGREVEVAEQSVAAVSPALEQRSIAVLPFVNMSADPEQEYFSDGLSEELLNLLANIPQLRVTSRSSAFFFKGKDYTMRDVGEQLGVTHVLEGSVRRSGKQIRITAQLIDVSTDAHIWSDTWDRAFEDVFTIQDEIAAAVTAALKIQLVDGLPHAFVTDSRAYDLYLEARDLVGEQTEAGALAAEALLLGLLEIDPEYAPGLALLGEAESFLGGWNYRPQSESFRRAKNYASRAVAASPSFSGGYALLTQLAIDHDRDLELAIRLTDEALRQNPTDIRARMVVGWLGALEGKHDERVKVAQELIRLDPLSGQAHWQQGHALMNAREYDQSVSAFRKMLELSPDATAGHAALAEALFLAGEYEEALAEFDAEHFKEFTYYGRAMTYYAMGDQGKSDAALNTLLGFDGAELWSAQIAMVYAVRRDNDEAFIWLDRALELNDQGVLGTQIIPFYDNIRGDPRYADFIERLWSPAKK